MHEYFLYLCFDPHVTRAKHYSYPSLIASCCFLHFNTGGIVRHLKHLTTAIRLDYHQFINDVEQTIFYAAQQVEAQLSDYHPPTVLVSILDPYLAGV